MREELVWAFAERRPGSAAAAPAVRAVAGAG
jgi:hypothetical protein